MNALDTSHGPDPSHILLVEDNPGDVILMLEALQGSKAFRSEIHVVQDGEKALDFLHKRGAHAEAPRPDLILLDLKLPRIDGLDVLAIIKEEPALKRIPVVVFTSSNSLEDIAKAYDLHANCFITKPMSLDQFTKVLVTTQEFWLTLVKRPGSLP